MGAALEGEGGVVDFCWGEEGEGVGGVCVGEGGGGREGISQGGQEEESRIEVAMCCFCVKSISHLSFLTAA